MSVQNQRPTSAAAAAGGDQLRSAAELESGRHQGLARHSVRVGLKQVDVRAGILEAVGEVLLQRRLLARRLARPARGGIEADQCARELDQVVEASGDPVADPLLLVRQPHT